jgi:hypothetical protein
MKHRLLTLGLGLGLTTLACGSPSEPAPPATGDEPEDPGPTPMGGKPAVTPKPPRDAALSPDAAPPLVTPPEVTPTSPPDAASDVASPDAAPADPSPPDAGPSAPPPTGPAGPYTCSMVVGIQATGDWFNAGFEKIVDNDRWQLMEVHSAFINLWADPKNSIWGSKPSSACKMNAANPDRVILVVLSNHWETWTLDQWVTPIIATMKNYKAKYSNLKNLELSTFVRSPGDKPCPLGDTFRQYDLAVADAAFAKVAAMFPELVTVAPIVHVDSCADYNNHPPHLQLADPAARAAKKMGAIYKDPAKP